MSHTTTQTDETSESKMYSRRKLTSHLQRARYALRRHPPPSLDGPDRVGPLYLIVSQGPESNGNSILQGPCYFFKSAQRLRYKNVTVPASFISNLYDRDLVEFYGDVWEAMKEFVQEGTA